MPTTFTDSGHCLGRQQVQTERTDRFWVFHFVIPSHWLTKFHFRNCSTLGSTLFPRRKLLSSLNLPMQCYLNSMSLKYTRVCLALASPPSTGLKLNATTMHWFSVDLVHLSKIFLIVVTANSAWTLSCFWQTKWYVDGEPHRWPSY